MLSPDCCIQTQYFQREKLFRKKTPKEIKISQRCFQLAHFNRYVRFNSIEIRFIIKPRITSATFHVAIITRKLLGTSGRSLLPNVIDE